MTTDLTLLSPVQLGPYTLPNRIVLAPLTRNRAGAGYVPTALNATYYAQRASGGLLITEASQIAPAAMGYPDTPGIYSPEQVAGWQLVTDAVHAKGGRIFLQLWHVGRISHPSLQPNGQLPVAPSPIAPAGMAATYTGLQPFVTPRALELDEIPAIVTQYAQAAKNAMAAGFDGVEIHSANGYLLDQFLRDGTNHRTDAYGGSIANRSRFLLEVVEAVSAVWGSDRVGVRLSPSGTFNDMADSDPKTLFTEVVRALNTYKLAYLHLVEPRAEDETLSDTTTDLLDSRYFRAHFDGPLIAAGGYTRELGDRAIAAGNADLVAFGRLYISNPDLVERFAHDAALNPYDRNTFYGGDSRGYTDYPTLQSA